MRNWHAAGYSAHAWAKQGADLRAPSPGKSRKFALLGVLDHSAGKLILHRSRAKRSTDFPDLLVFIDAHDEH
jgi:hypothetical protein